MIYRVAPVLMFGLISATAALAQKQTVNDLIKYVDPYIGTGGHGHVFLGANVPFGAVQLGPVNRSEGWDWCSGYHYSDSTIIGFSHTHLSGTGIGDLGDILIMPAVGTVLPKKGNTYKDGYLSLFSHKNETVRPGYYSVSLDRYNIKAELTATARVGLHKYQFPQSDSSQLIIDLREGIGWDLATETMITKVNDTTITGYRYSKGWAADQRIYFAAVLSKPVKSLVLYDSTLKKNGNELRGRFVKAIAYFPTNSNENVLMKVGISPVSIENAMGNIQAELPGWNFEETATAATDSWNRELNRIQIKSSQPSVMRIFYTALYHTMIAPSLFNDHNGDYRGTDKKIYRNADFNNLTTMSLWDTYRGYHPLFTIIHEDRITDLINSMLMIYKQQGKLPVWHLMGNETNTMPGYSGVPVVADAFLKGYKGFDRQLAYEAVKATAMRDERGGKFVKQFGFIPADSMAESVSYGLEYSIADWSIAQMAKQLNKSDDYKYFTKRAKNYRNYFDPSVGFVRGRLSQTQWRTPYDPLQSKHMRGDFAEGNGWQYTWMIPHDVEGLIQMLGGEEPFIKKLDSLFVIHGDMGEEASPDISGLIGQYPHGNEPCHHVTYLYAFAGEPWKTAEKIRMIADSLYFDKPAGLPGNEDVGQMSAWYILSAMGFYSVNPANGLYVFGSPLVDDAKINLANGKSFSITVKNNSAKNKYIQNVLLNGRQYTKSYIMHEDIIKGGNIIITMGDRPSPSWGVKKADRPYSVTIK